MALTSYDVLETSGVIIIGLTLLLTLQSVSSSFLENEMNNFFESVNSAVVAQEENYRFLSDCDWYAYDASSYVENITKIKIDYPGYDFKTNKRTIIPIKPFDNFGNVGPGNETIFDKFHEKFQEKCAEAAAQYIEINSTITALEIWGAKKGYLTEDFKKGSYFKEVASGPLTVVVVNLVMIMPFAMAGIVEIISSKMKNMKNEEATELGVYFLLGGFIMLVIGFVMIGIAFYHANSIIYSQEI